MIRACVADEVSSSARLLGEHRGAREGPTLVAVGGIHGNEPAGLLAAERVLELLDRDDGLRCGRVVALRGNLRALGLRGALHGPRSRYVDHDLNRLFVEGDGPTTSAETVERDELRACLAVILGEDGGEGGGGRGHPGVVLDLHTVSSPCVPFIAMEDSLPTRRFAMGFGLPKVLGIEEVIPGLLMDEATARHGSIALTVEGGVHTDPASVETLEAVLWRSLELLGMLSPTEAERARRADRFLRDAAGVRRGRVYDVRYRAGVRDVSFRAEDGIEALAKVRAGRSVLATELGQPVLAGESGLLFMLNRQPDPRPGDDAYFIVRRVGRAWLGLSALLRRPRWMHGLLAWALPGVRRHPEEPGALVVDPRVAAVLKREVFHVFGYRLVRFDVKPGPRAVGRLMAGVKIVLSRALGGRRSRERAHGDDAWVVRRRRLDDAAPAPEGGGA
ncbi:MAG: succinylglutamate desuccinylase/aspartoacylase family protein [Planctomycetota bacterium]